MFQILLIALTQVKAGNTSDDLLNEIGHSFYSVSNKKGITKKVYKKLNQNKYKNSPHRLLLKLTNKINLRGDKKSVTFSVCTTHGKI